ITPRLWNQLFGKILDNFISQFSRSTTAQCSSTGYTAFHPCHHWFSIPRTASLVQSQVRHKRNTQPYHQCYPECPLCPSRYAPASPQLWMGLWCIVAFLDEGVAGVRARAGFL